MKENSKIVLVKKRLFKMTWSEEEDRILFSMAELDKKNSWKQISKMLNNKTPSQCFYRFHSKNSLVFKKNWTKDEDKIIKEFIKANGKRWDELVKILSFRTQKQIKERFFNKLDDSLIRSKFSSEEDEKIVSLFLKYGSKWSFMSRFFSGRTPGMIKSRFYSSLQKKIIESENCNKIHFIEDKVN
jgi:myb proto-oncogene protein